MTIEKIRTGSEHSTASMFSISVCNKGIEILDLKAVCFPSVTTELQCALPRVFNESLTKSLHAEHFLALVCLHSRCMLFLTTEFFF